MEWNKLEEKVHIRAKRQKYVPTHRAFNGLL